MSPSHRALAALRPTTSQAAATNASLLGAVMLAGVGKRLEEGEEPVRAAVVPEAVDLREVERQVVGSATPPEWGKSS